MSESLVTGHKRRHTPRSLHTGFVGVLVGTLYIARVGASPWTSANGLFYRSRQYNPKNFETTNVLLVAGWCQRPYIIETMHSYTFPM